MLASFVYIASRTPLSEKMRARVLRLILLFLCCVTCLCSNAHFQVVLSSAVSVRDPSLLDVCTSAHAYYVPSGYDSLRVAYSESTWSAAVEINHIVTMLSPSAPTLDLTPAQSTNGVTLSIRFTPPPGLLCSGACPTGFRRVGSAAPYTCQECNKRALSRAALCETSTHELCANPHNAVVDRMWYVSCDDVSTPDTSFLKLCPETYTSDDLLAHGPKWFLRWDDEIPPDKEACLRQRQCKHGSYMTFGTNGRYCARCDDDGVEGLHGAVPSVATALSGTTLEQSCVCARGMVFDALNRRCVFCPPATFQNTTSLASACTPCLHACAAQNVYGSTTCAGCPAGTYFSGVLQKCRSCPSSWEMLQQVYTGDFDVPVGATRDTHIINASLCGSTNTDGSCTQPRDITAARTTCAVGFETDSSSDFSTTCRACMPDMFSPTGKKCQPKSVCHGDTYGLMSDSTVQDTACLEEDLAEQWHENNWQYPVSATLQGVSFADAREFSLLALDSVQCLVPDNWATASAWYANRIYEAWRRGEGVVLPFAAAADCVFACRPGSMRVVAARNRCEPCPPGSFSSTHDASACTPCAPGTYSDVAGAQVCDACPANTFQNATGSVSCKACCELGTTACSSAACTADRSYLNGACVPGSTTHNCAACPTNASSHGTASTWTHYGVLHCFRADACTAIPNSSGWEDTGTCKPRCDAGMYAAFSEDAGWGCQACDRDASRCKPGEFLEDACADNTNTQCRSCLDTLPPYARLTPAALPTATDPCASTCREPESAQQRFYLTPHSAAEVVRAHTADVVGVLQARFPGIDVAKVCIPSSIPTDLCLQGGGKLWAPVLDVNASNVDFLRGDFMPNDASQPVWPYIECQPAGDIHNVTVGQIFRQNFAGRRLLQATVDTLCDANFYMQMPGSRCVQCSIGRMSLSGASSAQDCFCRPGFFEAVASATASCEPCPVGNRVFCPGGFLSSRKPSNVGGSELHRFRCDYGAPDKDNTTQCACPGHTSNQLPLASGILDCVPDAGHRWNLSAVAAGAHATEPCANSARDIHLTVFLGMVSAGRISSNTVCPHECSSELGGVAVAAGDAGFCDCDAQKNLQWSESSASCVCAPGFYPVSGAVGAGCTLCPANFYCSDTKRECPVGMFSPPGSTTMLDCVCDSGMFRKVTAGAEDGALILSCSLCFEGYYCQDGVKQQVCREPMFCTSAGLAAPEHCAVAEIRDVETRQCKNFDTDEQKETGPLLFVNALRRTNDSQYEIYAPVVDAALIHGLESISWEHFSIRLRIVPNLGVVASSYQLLCGAARSVIVAPLLSEQPTLRVQPGAFRCANESFLQRRLVSTLDLQPTTYAMGTGSFFDTTAVLHQAQSAFASFVFDQARAHLTWGVYLDCPFLHAPTPWYSSEFQIRAEGCPSGSHMRLHHAESVPIQQDGADDAFVYSYLLPVDVPSQVQWRAQLSESTGGVVMYVQQTRRAGVAGAHDTAVLVHAGSAQRAFALPTFALASARAGRLVFALHMPLWQYAADFDPRVVLGLCSANGFFSLVVFRVVHNTASEVEFDAQSASEAQDLCRAPGYGVLSAHMHHNYLFLFNHARPADGVFSVQVTELTPRTIGQERNLIFRSRGSGDHGLAQMPGFVTSSAWHTNCASSAISVNLCKLNIFALRTGADGGASAFTKIFPTNAPGKVSAADCTNCYPRDYIWSDVLNASTLCTHVTAIDACQHSMTKFALFSGRHAAPPDRIDDEDPSEFFDVVLALERPRGDIASPVFLLHVHFNATTQHVRVLNPVFLRNAIYSMHFSPVPTPPTPAPAAHYDNLLASRGALFVAHFGEAGDLLVDRFELECGGCGGEYETLDTATGECQCRPGSIPLTLPCFDHCTAARFSLSLNASVDFVPALTGGENGYIHLCLPSTGALYSVDGTRAGVQRCPNGTYALASGAATENDCKCDEQTRKGGRVQVSASPAGLAVVEARAWTEETRSACSPCQHDVVCSALSNQKNELLRCHPNSTLKRTSSRRQDALVHSYVCACDDDFYSVSMEETVFRHTMPPELANFAWPAGSVLRTDMPTREFVHERHTCAPCVNRSYACVHGKSQACPAGAQAAHGNWSQCTCPAGTVLDKQAHVCRDCRASVDFVCVNGVNESCSSPAHPLCPCAPVDGLAMITAPGGDRCKTVCPEAHYCPALLAARDVLSVHIPRPCPAGMTAPAGSRSSTDCSCMPGYFYDTDTGAGSCSLCRRDHWCTGSQQMQACPTNYRTVGEGAQALQDCVCAKENGGACTCDAGMLTVQSSSGIVLQCTLHPDHPRRAWTADGTGEECAPGFGEKDAVQTVWDAFQRRYVFEGHPFASVYAVALRQYAAEFAAKHPGDCVLCPPGLLCLGGRAVKAPIQKNITQHPRQYNTHLLGASSAGDDLFDCPGPIEHALLGHPVPVSVGSCFDLGFPLHAPDASLMTSALQRAPAGLVLLGTDVLGPQFDARVWAALRSGHVNQVNDLVLLDLEDSVAFRVFSPGLATAVGTIDSVAVTLQYLTAVATEDNRRKMMQALRAADAGSGLASQLLVPTLWALSTRHNGLTGHGASNGSVFGEPVVLVPGVPKTTVTFAIAVDVVGIITRFCTGVYSLWTDKTPPRIVFAIDSSDIASTTYMQMLSVPAHNMLFMPAGLCADASCSAAYPGALAVPLHMPPYSIAVTAELSAALKEHRTLSTLLDVSSAWTASSEKVCPFGMQVDPQALFACRTCTKTYASREFFDEQKQTCVPCGVLRDVDCAGIDSTLLAHACTFLSDAQCV